MKVSIGIEIGEEYLKVVAGRYRGTVNPFAGLLFKAAKQFRFMLARLRAGAYVKLNEE